MTDGELFDQHVTQMVGPLIALGRFEAAFKIASNYVRAYPECVKTKQCIEFVLANGHWIEETAKKLYG